MYLEALKQEERFHLRFCRPIHREKGVNNNFCIYKLTKKLCLLYLKVKLQENTQSCCIQYEKCQKTLDIKDLEENKH